MKNADEWFEYDCPVQGIDFDVRPVPEYGSEIACSACGGKHIANETLGTAWRSFKDGRGVVSEVTDEWRSDPELSRFRAQRLILEKENHMNPEEAAIATELANGIRSLNAALEKAYNAGLEVRVDCDTMQEIGKRFGLRVYYAEVSKQAFSQRVG